MAGEAVWTRRAAAELEAYLDYLESVRPSLVDEASRELREAADAVARRPGIARPSQWWDGLLERSHRRWKKLLVLQRVGDGVQVLAFYDQRQDLSAVDPFSK